MASKIDSGVIKHFIVACCNFIVKGGAFITFGRSTGKRRWWRWGFGKRRQMTTFHGERISRWKIGEKGQRTTFKETLIAGQNRPGAEVSVVDTGLWFHSVARLAIRKVPAKRAIALKLTVTTLAYVRRRHDAVVNDGYMCGTEEKKTKRKRGRKNVSR